MESKNSLANLVYQNAKMGEEGIGHIYGYAKAEGFRKLLKAQAREYRDIAGRAGDLIEGQGGEPKALGMMQKAGSFLSSEVNAAVDRTDSHLAEMMMTGTTMGICKVIRALHRNQNAGAEEIALARCLCETEEKNFALLKEYL